MSGIRGRGVSYSRSFGRYLGPGHQRRHRPETLLVAFVNAVAARERVPRFLRKKLEGNSKPMPADFCAVLKLPEGSTYAQAVKLPMFEVTA